MKEIGDREILEKAKKGKEGMFLTIEYAPCYGIELSTARRFTEEEKKGYRKEYAETGMVGTGFRYPLSHVTKKELPERESDGSFPGSYNLAWIISESEFNEYYRMNEEREQAQKEEERRKREEEEEIERKNQQEKEELLAKIDFWKIEEKDIKDEGGRTKTYRHIFLIGGEELCFVERNAFDIGTVINPDYAVAEGHTPGGVATCSEEGLTVWMDFVDSEGWVEVRPLTEKEEICYKIVAKYGKFAKASIRM